MRRSELIRVRLTPKERVMLERLANKRMSMSDVIRLLIKQKYHIAGD